MPNLRQIAAARRHDPAMLYLAAFVAMGFAATLLGPAIPLLRELTDSSESEISLLFVIPAPAYILSSVIAGRLYDRGGGHRVLVLGLAIMAVGATLVPLLDATVVGLGVGFAVLGVGMSLVDVGCNTLLVWSRSGDVGSIMNALHLCFGIGALVGPLSVGLSEWWLGDLRFACGVVVVVALAVAVVAWRTPSPLPRAAGQNMAEPAHGRRAISHRGALVLVAVFFALYVGIEIGFAGWISTYAKDTGMGDAPIPAFVVATFWAGFTICRLVTVPIARRVAPARILAVSCAAAVVAAGAMVVAGDVSSVVWVATFWFGAAVAPQYPTMVALAEERIGLSGGATSMIVAGSSIGGLALPWLIGQRLDAIGVDALPQVITISAVVLLAWFWLVDRRTR